MSDCLFRSPVFRAAILSDMEDAKKGEVFISSYHFKVRAVDCFKRLGEFSEPKNIHLNNN